MYVVSYVIPKLHAAGHLLNYDTVKNFKSSSPWYSGGPLCVGGHAARERAHLFNDDTIKILSPWEQIFRGTTCVGGHVHAAGGRTHLLNGDTIKISSLKYFQYIFFTYYCPCVGCTRSCDLKDVTKDPNSTKFVL